MPAVHLQENSKLISGHVAEKKGYLYWVLNLTDENGKRKPKWIPTHKKVKGDRMLSEIRGDGVVKLLFVSRIGREFNGLAVHHPSGSRLVLVLKPLVQEIHKVKGNKTWANNMLPTIRKEWTEKLLQEATASQQSASPSGPSSAAISFLWRNRR